MPFVGRSSSRDQDGAALRAVVAVGCEPPFDRHRTTISVTAYSMVDVVFRVSQEVVELVVTNDPDLDVTQGPMHDVLQ